jgi:hypothetical protein
VRLTITTTALALFTIAAPAHAVPTPAQLCESAFELAAAKSVQCRLTAESKYSKTLDQAKRDATLSRCWLNLVSAYAKATGKYGAACPASNPAALDVYLDRCSDDAAAAAAGGPVPGPAPLLKTGQAASSGTGSDGDLEKGLARGYVDNGNGTITDTSTGLMWEKMADEFSIHRYTDTYTWTDAYSVKIAALNAGSGFAGYTDWRLPNLNELESIRDLGAWNPSVSSAFDANGSLGCSILTCSLTIPSFFWSSSSQQSDPDDFAYAVDFYIGEVLGELKTAMHVVRAVRGGS